MDLIHRIELIIEPALKGLGYDLVRVMMSGSRRQTLQVMIERSDQTGLSIDDCVKASRELSALLDVEDPIESSYCLEVSSPGLDRPLVKKADYDRFKEEPIKIQTHNVIEGYKRFQGILQEVSDEGIKLQMEEKTYEIPFREIRKASLNPDLGMNSKKPSRSKKNQSKANK